MATTDAPVPDTAMTATIHQHLARRDLLPVEHYLDAGYSSAELIVAAREQHQINLITPLRTDNSVQARTRNGYDRTAVTIDWDRRQVIEATIHQAVTVTGLCRAGYRGIEKVHLEHIVSAVAVDLIRLDAWWNGRPLNRKRTSRLARLEPALTA
ncbi:transposase [Nonomuraea sp. bgisy101]|uniref:transposase n=1 Tax=Nonomuraea sp. bgisy101 TaxID=3413784 RepID=UPI003D738F63